MANQFVAFQDDRHGLGAWVAERVAEAAAPQEGGRRAEAPGDGAARMATGSYGLSLSGGQTPAAGRRRDDPGTLGAAYRTWTSPRASAESTVAAVVSGQARFGVLPLLGDDGFDKETLAALIDFPAVRPAREFVASSNFVLAVPTDMIHEAEQAGYTDSFSAGGTNGFQWTEAKRRKYRNKVTTVLASGDAMRHCAPALDGFRAQGIDVQRVPDGVDTYREGLRIAAAAADPDRAVETVYDGSEQRRVSRTRAANHAKGLTAVLLTLDRAVGENGYAFDADYTVLDTGLAGADPVRTAYVTVAKEAPAKGAGGAKRAMSAIDAAFDADPRRLPASSSDDDRPSRADFVLPGSLVGEKGRDAPGFGSSLARVLWKVDTTGSAKGGKGRVGDYSPVIGLLNRAGLPHKITPLDGRPGNPVVIAFDVAPGDRRAVRPIIDRLSGLKGSQALGVFPATEPLVPTSHIPEGRQGPAVRTLKMVGVVVAALAVVLAWRLVAA